LFGGFGIFGGGGRFEVVEVESSRAACLLYETELKIGGFSTDLKQIF
jgi:hypothetical protein